MHIVSGKCLTLSPIIKTVNPDSKKEASDEETHHLVAMSCNDSPEQIWNLEFD